MSATLAYEQVVGGGVYGTRAAAAASSAAAGVSSSARSGQGAWTASPATTVTIDVRSALQPSLSAASDSSDNDDVSDLASLVSSEDARSFRSSAASRSRASRSSSRRSVLPRLYNLLAQCLDQTPRALDLAMRGLGPALVLLAWLLFGTCTYVFFASIVPVRAWSTTVWPGAFIIPFGLFLLWNVLYNHGMAVFTRPGGLPADWSTPSDIQARIRAEAATFVKGEGFTRYCKTCIRPKTPRMHHCHVCGTCVARMDHHCPWIGGCVGYYNYRYFYAFLFWLDVGCMYLVCCTLPLIAWPDEDQFVRLYELLDSSNESDNWLLTWWRPFSRHEAPIFFILVLTAAAFVAVGGMLAMHTYLVLTNQTTIEWYHNGRMQKRAQRRGESWSNVYDLDWRTNWLSVLGRGCGGALLASLFPGPIGFTRLDSDGLHFDERGGGEDDDDGDREDLRSV